MAGILTAGQDKAEQLEQLLAAILSPTVVTPTVVSATAQQDTTGLPSNVYVAITGGASGTVTVAIGPTNATATTIMPAANATLNQTVDFNLPAGWWFKVTVGGSAAIASAQQVTGI
ncbi:MAG TPA: hypothetical protein VG275_06885 [Solirubrobacteraceae bacterium]|jgi:hypothetical protein|nr:hypothetical protein [Solirubrobacteraceae bacterium]